MIYTVNEFNPKKVSSGINLLKRPAGQRKKHKKAPDYLDIVGAFDIETTTIFTEEEENISSPHSFMYVWQFQLGKDITVMGRTWKEYLQFLDKISELCSWVGIRYNLVKSPYLVVYVHNLAYEWAFLSGIWEFKNEDCFFKKERKPLYCIMKTVEFRDSLALSNMSLKKFAENVGCSVRKQSGQRYDYRKIRYPWTRLNEFEILYCIDDVITLEECIRLELDREGDTLYTIPLTSTGYVRRDCKKALLPIRNSINIMLPQIEEYKLLRRAFRGGNTHCNRWHSGKIIENVFSYDIRSSYPTQQLTQKFPMQRFKFIENVTPEKLLSYIEKDYAVCADFAFKDIRLKDKYEPVPYLALGCCDALRPVLDNGRILSCKYLEISLTEWDLLIVLDQYSFSQMEIINCMIAKKDFLPEPYRDVIMNYYRQKTELKHVQGKEYELGKAKNKLNSIYGMSATDAIRQTISYIDGVFKVSDYESEITLKNLMKAPFPYQWGVWTTALARWQLHIGMKQVKKDGNGVSRLVYCDTDSIKTIGETDLTFINSKLTEKAYECGAVATDVKGKEQPIGIWETDAHYKRFISHGAKRYAYENEKGELHITVSGVTHDLHEYYDENDNLIDVKEWASEELGKLENFQPGFIWYKAGGTTIVYNDNDDFDYITSDGLPIHITKNASIVDTTYEMKQTDDYIALINMCELYLDYKKQFE